MVYTFRKDSLQSRMESSPVCGCILTPPLDPKSHQTMDFGTKKPRLLPIFPKCCSLQMCRYPRFKKLIQSTVTYQNASIKFHPTASIIVKFLTLPSQDTVRRCIITRVKVPGFEGQDSLLGMSLDSLLGMSFNQFPCDATWYQSLRLGNTLLRRSKSKLGTP